MRSLAKMCLVLLLGAVLAGCGGSSPAGPTSSLPALERLAIAQQVVWTALGGLAPGILASRSTDGVPLSATRLRAGVQRLDLCRDLSGGRALRLPRGRVGHRHRDRRRHPGPRASPARPASPPGRRTPTARNTSGVTLNGDPDTTASGTVRFVNGELAGEQTVNLGRRRPLRVPGGLRPVRGRPPRDLHRRDPERLSHRHRLRRAGGRRVLIGPPGSSALARDQTTATLTQWIGGSESNRQSHSSPPSRPIQSCPVVVPK